MPTLPFDLANTLGLGREATELTFTQISLRGIIVFLAALAIVRCGDRRFLSQKTAFDAVLGFILASMLARAVNGTAAFFPTLGGGFVLVMVHRVLAYAARRSHAFGGLIKGRSDVIIREGALDEALAMRNLLSKHDVMEDLRLHGTLTTSLMSRSPCSSATGTSASSGARLRRGQTPSRFFTCEGV